MFFSAKNFTRQKKMLLKLFSTGQNNIIEVKN